MQALLEPRMKRINDILDKFGTYNEELKTKIEHAKIETHYAAVTYDLKRSEKFDKLRDMIKNVENDVQSNTTIEVIVRTTNNDKTTQTTSLEITPDTNDVAALLSYMDNVEKLLELLNKKNPVKN